MKLHHWYLMLCVPGAILPYTLFVPWLMEHGLDIPLFFEELFSTRIGGLSGLDVLVSGVTLFVFIWVEGKRLQMERLWLPVVATLGVGVSFGLPLFLYMRQCRQDKQNGVAG
jgi:hypothetical protein